MKIKINNEEFELRYMIESWKKLKSEAGITPTNIEDKLKDDFAGCISLVIFYGLAIQDRSKVTIQQLDEAFGFEVMDIVMPAIMESMPKAVRAMAEGDGTGKKLP